MSFFKRKKPNPLQGLYDQLSFFHWRITSCQREYIDTIKPIAALIGYLKEFPDDQIAQRFLAEHITIKDRLARDIAMYQDNIERVQQTLAEREAEGGAA